MVEILDTLLAPGQRVKLVLSDDAADAPLDSAVREALSCIGIVTESPLEMLSQHDALLDYDLKFGLPSRNTIGSPPDDSDDTPPTEPFWMRSSAADLRLVDDTSALDFSSVRIWTRDEADHLDAIIRARVKEWNERTGMKLKYSGTR